MKTKAEIIEILKEYQVYLGGPDSIIMGDAIPDWKYEELADCLTEQSEGVSEVEIKNCPICKTTSSVSLNETTIPEQYTCNSCEFTWDKLN